MDDLENFITKTSIAFFSMEIALRDEMHTYAGGLGVLAGDMGRTSADLDLPIVFVSLLSRQGYVRQSLSPSGIQRSDPDPWTPEAWAHPLPAMTALDIAGNTVWVRPWLHIIKGARGAAPVLLLDTDLEQNAPADRRITDRLYIGSDSDRLKQEMVLGIAGEALLRALGFTIRTYHLNEGHAALLPVALLRRTARGLGRKNKKQFDIAGVRDRCVFTTHTPVQSAFDRFDYALAQTLLGDFFSIDDFKSLSGTPNLNMTSLALELCGYVNGVAERHTETAERMFPGRIIRSITNGVHVPTWMHPAIASIFDKGQPHWMHEPEVLAFADLLGDEDLWAAHQTAKSDLISEVQTATGRDLKPDLPIIGFGRRMTSYKRPELLFSDLDRLREIAGKYPFQIVAAGIAHPADTGGLELLAMVNRKIAELEGSVPAVFLCGYTMRLAKILTAGCDIWLNTPQPPLEASGTSGMKAALNGVLNLSVKDGWWVEGCVEGVTGWGLEGEPRSSATELYQKLEEVVLPLYAHDRARWLFMMKQAISKIAPMFNSQRMIRRYVSEAYMTSPGDY